MISRTPQKTALIIDNILAGGLVTSVDLYDPIAKEVYDLQQRIEELEAKLASAQEAALDQEFDFTNEHLEKEVLDREYAELLEKYEDSLSVNANLNQIIKEISKCVDSKAQ